MLCVCVCGRVCFPGSVSVCRFFVLDDHVTDCSICHADVLKLIYLTEREQLLLRTTGGKQGKKKNPALCCSILKTALCCYGS